MTTNHTDSIIIDNMKQYYDARAAEYDEWFYRRGRYDHGPELNQRWHDDAQILADALEHFNMSGDILELAPGTGIWTEQIVRNADSVTAVDASEQMISINRNKLRDCAAAPDFHKVTYQLADLFEWQPDNQYDGVFFAFWLSHVPTERLDEFLEKVARALNPGGKLLFADSRPDQTMSARNHKLPEAGSQVMKRVLNDGRSYDIIKNFFDPTVLQAKFAHAGLKVDVRETPHYFIYGTGNRV